MTLRAPHIVHRALSPDDVAMAPTATAGRREAHRGGLRLASEPRHAEARATGMVCLDNPGQAGHALFAAFVSHVMRRAE